MNPTFVAIDFETASYQPESACSIGLVRVEDGQVIDTLHLYIKPPIEAHEFVFSWLHGIDFRKVEFEPNFGRHWKQISKFIRGVDFLAAHSAGFDRKVLMSCCAAFDIESPSVPFLCTVRLARKAWNLFPTKLPNVAEHLGISLNHHDALSDSRVSAEAVRRALEENGLPEQREGLIRASLLSGVKVKKTKS